MEHRELGWRFVDIAPILTIEITPFDLSSNMKERRAGGHRFNESAGSVACTGPGAGYDNAERATRPRRSIRHIGGSSLTSGGHKAHDAARMKSTEDWHVVNADDAERKANAVRFEDSGDEIADGFDGIRHSGSA